MLPGPANTTEDHALRDSLQELFERAPCGYIFMQPDGRLTRVNQTFVDLTGYPREELEGSKRFQDLLTIAGRIFYENQYAPLIRLQGFVKEVTFDLVHPNGDRIPILVNAVERVDTQKRPVEVACTVFEATERRTYERELLLARRRAEQLAGVISVSHDAILSVATGGSVLSWNPAAEHLFGGHWADLPELSAGALIPAFAHAREWQRIVTELAAGHPLQIETLGQRKDGSRIEISAGLAAQFGDSGELIAISLIIRDIGERRALERQKDEFLATVSHDLKNPVASIKGWAQLLMRRAHRLPAPEREQWQHDLTTIEVTTRRLAAMIDELLDLTYVGMGRPLELHLQPTDLVALARRVANENQQLTDDHRITVQTPLETLLGVWDRARLERVVANLVSNAIKYSPDGGEVTLTLGQTVTSNGPVAQLSVSDRGLGIPFADQARIFDRFYRGASVASWIPGSGLGLASAKQLVDLHGGSISVDSAPSRGTTFVVQLPIANGAE
ncbi:MAG: hypothetical protein NVSMB2_05130 [Chloroflexota bacterium]